ncbi:MBOAT family O-acyltransferase, partial [Polaribacter sargassicola]|uniref:MBOAT family O-acyltransferase n=2 Tax=Polaribacter sargassicola TaxID=2836891 RepID=UPI0027B9478A
LFKKIVIADNCAEFANQIFNNSAEMNGSTLFLGAIFFTFQIYGDFSGYSDIAIGTSRLFGFDLKQNFAFPYFSRDMAEFWRRWHISLSTWFRDYLYIPLGGSRGGTWMKVRNTFIIFIVSGFWHGANWTFIVWGLLNAVYFLPIMLTKNNRNNIEIVAKGKYLPSLREFISMLITFCLTVFAWIFFRSENMSQALQIVNEILSLSFFEKTSIFPTTTILIIMLFLFIEWNGRNQQYAIMELNSLKNKLSRYSFYVFLAIIIYLNHSSGKEFIYFQF